MLHLQALNGVLLTDGAGLILRSFSDLSLQLDPRTDLVQFRYNGAKGVLLKVDQKDFPTAESEKKILMRKSNLKFKTDSVEFGCVRQSYCPGNI
jgi:hypothetical protein